MSHARLAGQFRLTVHRADGTLRLITPWCDNLVTDTGLNRIGLGAFLTHCYVGTGSVPPPAATDNGLVSQVASTTQILAQSAWASNAAPHYGYASVTYKFAVATGNLAEVGVGWSGGLFARALLVDGNGDPTVITVLPEESLGVTYLLRNYAPAADENFSAVIGGVTHACTARAALVTSGSTSNGWGVTGGEVTAGEITAYNGALGAVTSAPGGTTATITGGTAAYVSNSNERALSGNWTETEGNLAGGITALLLRTNGMGAYQIALDPPIAKTDMASLLVAFKVAWGRP